jgi:hypothetical protein
MDLSAVAHECTEKCSGVAAIFLAFPGPAKLSVVRGAAVVMICVAASGVLGFSFLAAQVNAISAKSLKDQEQDDRLWQEDKSILSVGERIDRVEVEREKWREVNDAWKTAHDKELSEERDRMNRDEGMCIGAFTVIGALHGIGLLRRFKSAAVAEED